MIAFVLFMGNKTAKNEQEQKVEKAMKLFKKGKVEAAAALGFEAYSDVIKWMARERNMPVPVTDDDVMATAANICEIEAGADDALLGILVRTLVAAGCLQRGDLCKQSVELALPRILEWVQNHHIPTPGDAMAA